MFKIKTLTKKEVGLIALIVIIIAVLCIIFIAQYNELLSRYNKLSNEHQKLIEASQVNNSFIQRYNGMKYPVESGIRRYIGKEPLRIYPSSKAPYVYKDWNPDVVELINEVSTQNEAGYNEGTWCLVLDSARGISGYVNRSDLITIDEKDKDYFHDYGSGIETLGGFKVGERIETLIGLLDQDYYLIYENGRIYEFPDNKSKLPDDPMNLPFSGVHTLDAFVWENNHVSTLRTDSPDFALKDGYKVGDNANKVLDYYASKYKYFKKTESDNEYSDYTFVLEGNHMLQFYIDSEKLNSNSVIKYIEIN